MPVLYANHSWSNRALTEVHVREFRVGRGLVGLWIVLRSAADVRKERSALEIKKATGWWLSCFGLRALAQFIACQ